MGLLILMAVVFVGVVIYNTFFDWYGDFGMGVLLGFISVFGIFILGLIASLFFDSEVIKTEELEIGALKDNSVTGGSFFLGSGNIEEDNYYFYMIDTDKGKKMSKAEAENSYINEGDYSPKVEIHESYFKSKFAKFMFGERGWQDSEYIFYVPANTVTSEFNIDME